MSVKDIFPLTIIADRYNGVFSGGKYTAWGCDPWDIPPEVDDGDNICRNFWETYDLPVGRGETPMEAYYDLIVREREFQAYWDKEHGIT